MGGGTGVGVGGVCGECEVVKARFVYIMESLEARPGRLMFIMWIPRC